MTHRGPFQPRTFCDSVILLEKTDFTKEVNKSHKTWPQRKMISHIS